MIRGESGDEWSLEAVALTFQRHGAVDRTNNHIGKTLKLPTWSADKGPQGSAVNAGIGSESRRGLRALQAKTNLKAQNLCPRARPRARVWNLSSCCCGSGQPGQLVSVPLVQAIPLIILTPQKLHNPFITVGYIFQGQSFDFQLIIGVLLGLLQPRSTCVCFISSVSRIKCQQSTLMLPPVWKLTQEIPRRRFSPLGNFPSSLYDKSFW